MSFILFKCIFGIIGASSANRKFIKVEFSGDITKINGVTFVDDNGKTLVDNLDFTINNSKKQELTDEVENIETNIKDEVNIEVEEIPDVPFYVRVSGKDAKGTKFLYFFEKKRTIFFVGNDFTRLSYFNANNVIYTLPALSVVVGLGSELLASPNQIAQIFFEVTNNRDQTVFVRFRCTDDKSLLVRMLPVR